MTDSQQTAPQEQTSMNMSLQDVQSLLKIVEVAASRGAFRANEFSNIGQVCDRVNAFLSAFSQLASANKEDSAETKGE